MTREEAAALVCDAQEKGVRLVTCVRNRDALRNEIRQLEAKINHLELQESRLLREYEEALAKSIEAANLLHADLNDHAPKKGSDL